MASLVQNHTPTSTVQDRQLIADYIAEGGLISSSRNRALPIEVKQAFQKELNRHLKPESRIAVDGVLGRQTSAAIRLFRKPVECQQMALPERIF